MKKIFKFKELKYGIFLGSIYLVWAIFWMFQKYINHGSIRRPYYPQQSFENELIKPFQNDFFFGTDIYGRSLFEVLSSGLVYSLSVAIFVSLIAAFFGLMMGYLSVVGGRLSKKFVDMLINLIFIFPNILIAILVMSVSGNSIVGLILALILTGWSGYAKISRGEIKRVMGLSYVEGAKAIGTSNFRLFFKIVVPSVTPQLLIHIILGISGVIISESTLGFLGLGGSEYSWGSLLGMAKDVLLESPHVAIITSSILAGLIISLNLLGDGLRDYLDPKSKGRAEAL